MKPNRNLEEPTQYTGIILRSERLLTEASLFTVMQASFGGDAVRLTLHPPNLE
jgi:hypothetical protein